MAEQNQINAVQEPEEGHDDTRTELVFPLERLHIRTSQLLNNADKRMTEILRKMMDEKLKETMIQIQEELREAKENVREITELKMRVDDHDKRLRAVERDHHHGMLQVPVGRRNPSVDSDVGYESRDTSSSSLRRVLEEDLDEEKTLLDPEDETN